MLAWAIAWAFFMDLTKLQTILLKDAVKHYIQHQVGVSSAQGLEYETILKLLEDHLRLLNW